MGVVLLAVLLLILMLTVSAGGMVQVYQTQTKREKEQELLFRGDQIRRGIYSYYNVVSQAGEHQLPPNLDALLEDSRVSPAIQHLRVIYVDPITGKNDWILIQRPDGVIGVHSRSTATPLKVEGFPISYGHFRNASSYSLWDFQIKLR